ncbi:MAG: methyltransferase domain-containing protein, partial [Planctomycetota bacterium]
FASPSDSLGAAQHRLALLNASFLTGGGRVLDVGCGLGGTTALLAALGHQAVGIDPCDLAVHYARESAGAAGDVRFEPRSFVSLAEQAASEHDLFDGLVFIEVLQHMPRLEPLFEHCVKLLRPDGVIVISDVVTIPELPWRVAPFHRRGSVMAAALGRGFRARHQEVAVAHVLPTLDLIVDGLERQRNLWCDEFADLRPQLAAEIRELISQCLLLKTAFENGDLAYEITALCRAERTGA